MSSTTTQFEAFATYLMLMLFIAIVAFVSAVMVIGLKLVSTIWDDTKVYPFIWKTIVDQNQSQLYDLPPDFLVNHISGSFVEMVLWWIQNKQKQTPEELDRYFRTVIEPILNSPHL